MLSPSFSLNGDATLDILGNTFDTNINAIAVGNDWNVPRTVTVLRIDDGVIDDDITYPILLDIASSDDPNYVVGPLPPVNVTNVAAVPRLLGDFDGDGMADLALYEYDPSRNAGGFAVRLSNNGTPIDRTASITGVEANVIPVAGVLRRRRPDRLRRGQPHRDRSGVPAFA